MPVIAVVGTKGGTGKTTLCAALAIEAAKKSPRVAIYDADPQKSITSFMLARTRREPNPELFNGADTVTDAVEALEITGWDWVFLDGLPGSLLVTEEMIGHSDFVIVPARPSTLDLLASQDAIEMAQELRKPYLVVINGARGESNKLVKEARGYLFNHGIPFADTVISNRDAYASAMARGQVAPQIDKGAEAEIASLWKEIHGALTKGSKAATPAPKKAGAR